VDDVTAGVLDAFLDHGAVAMPISQAGCEDLPER
jgi:hypothetical protein